MSAEIKHLPPSSHMSVEQALESAKDAGICSVLVIGESEEGTLITRSSKLTRAEALWLVELARDNILGRE